MRWIMLSVLLSMFVAGCAEGDSTDPQSDVLVSVRSALEILQAGFDRENETLVSQSAGSRFVLGGNVSIRYSDVAFSGSGQAAMRSFFGGAFDTLANVEQELEIREVNVIGDVAIAQVDTTFTALRLDRTPAENIIFSGVDYMLFEREAGGWRLMRWDDNASNVPTPDDG